MFKYEITSIHSSEKQNERIAVVKVFDVISASITKVTDILNVSVIYSGMTVDKTLLYLVAVELKNSGYDIEVPPMPESIDQAPTSAPNEIINSLNFSTMQSSTTAFSVSPEDSFSVPV